MNADKTGVFNIYFYLRVSAFIRGFFFAFPWQFYL